MPDYRRMYYLLRAGVSSVLDDMRADGEFQSIYQRLETLLQEAEEVYSVYRDFQCHTAGRPVGKERRREMKYAH